MLRQTGRFLSRAARSQSSQGLTESLSRDRTHALPSSEVAQGVSSASERPPGPLLRSEPSWSERSRVETQSEYATSTQPGGARDMALTPDDEGLDRTRSDRSMETALASTVVGPARGPTGLEEAGLALGETRVPGA